MSKTCPKCGKTVEDNAKFCMDCGYAFSGNTSSKSQNIFSNGKVFLVIIALILILGTALILTSGNGGNNSNTTADDVQHVDMTIKDVLGYSNDYDNKTKYTIYTNALFIDVPSDLEGYIIKTSYCDENDTVLGQETEKLANVYYDTDYDISFGYYDSYKN